MHRKFAYDRRALVSLPCAHRLDLLDSQAKQNETGRRMAELEAQLHALKVDRDALSIRAQTLAQCLAQKQQAGGSGSSAAQDSGSAGPADTSVSSPAA